MPETVIVNLPAQSEQNENNPPTNQNESLAMLSQLITSNHQTLIQLIQQLETMIAEVKTQLADLQSEVNETLTEMEAEETEAEETEVTITEVIVPPVPNDENREDQENPKPIQQSKLAKMLFM